MCSEHEPSDCGPVLCLRIPRVSGDDDHGWERGFFSRLAEFRGWQDPGGPARVDRNQVVAVFIAE